MNIGKTTIAGWVALLGLLPSSSRAATPLSSAVIRANYPSVTRSIQIGPDGSVFWEGQRSTLYEILADMRAFHQQHPEPKAGLFVEPEGSPANVVAWVFDEAGKAGIENAWFGSSAKAPGLGSAAAGQTPLASAPPLSWVPANAWTHAGRETPIAAFETILWAGVNGDDGALADAIDLGDLLAYLNHPGGIRLVSATASEGAIHRPDPPEISRQKRLEILRIARKKIAMTAVQFYGLDALGSDSKVVCALGLDAGGSPHFLKFFLGRRKDGWHLLNLYEIINGAFAPIGE